ncbi:CRISPR-associated protein Csx10 [Caldanaerobius fijiensis DSM 17918]|uniref:CRISPR-associated protein Csx10 n=1 Tax=Caldanaerobius fijiensis DSM 17918 TaxID=1121256 RepID=A0A1M5BR88_9THEO|nr:RAMP superfamily CRISPR-associated protein [Caldanaerobius fijiensis]SHF45064.1 CRISPR-associated protein Csx10 [Caldanaerobius fijiensis DSM 17918]
MYKIQYDIQIQSPVILSEGYPERNLTETLDYIPGSTVLGVLAAVYKYQKKLDNPHLDDTFYRWFIKGDLIFENAYIAVCVNTISKKYERTWPIPLYIQQNKKGDKYYNVFLLEPEEQTEPISGYFSNTKNSRIVNVKRRINVHNERDEFLGHSVDGKIFNYEYIEPGQKFIGEIYGDKKDLEQLRELVGEERNIRIGKSKNVEYGSALLTFHEIEEYKKDELFQSEHLEDNKVVLTFTSPCILLNGNGYPDISIHSLKRYLDEVFGEKTYDIKNYVAKSMEIENYYSAWQAKKPLDKAYAAGSSFVIEFMKDAMEFEEELQRVLLYGIGERTNEGFGRVKLDYVFEEKYSFVKGEKDNDYVVRPNGRIPQLVVDIIKYNVREELKKKVEITAIQEAKVFERESGKVPANSLLGRLELMARDCDKDEYIKNVKKVVGMGDKENNENRRERYKPAYDSLTKCHNGNQTLLEFIINCKFIKELEEGNAIYNLIQVDRGTLREFLTQEQIDECKDIKTLFKIYWINFFGELRKYNKEKKEMVSND